jgi:hypothetical protein
MKRFVKYYYLVVTLAIPFSGMLLALSSSYDNSYLKIACTRFCHNLGCVHGSVLPDFLIGNDGLFGITINYLLLWGKFLQNNFHIPEGTGYGAINLIIFCLLIPAIHLFFIIVNLKMLK